MSVTAKVILTADEDGGFVIECPALPGCFSQGETPEEALANIREAIEGVILARADLGRPVTAEELEATMSPREIEVQIAGAELERSRQGV